MLGRGSDNFGGRKGGTRGQISENEKHVQNGLFIDNDRLVFQKPFFFGMLNFQGDFHEFKKIVYTDFIGDTPSRLISLLVH